VACVQSVKSSPASLSAESIAATVAGNSDHRACCAALSVGSKSNVPGVAPVRPPVKNILSAEESSRPKVCSRAFFQQFRELSGDDELTEIIPWVSLRSRSWRKATCSAVSTPSATTRLFRPLAMAIAAQQSEHRLCGM
jgi:hypothetical protein